MPEFCSLQSLFCKQIEDSPSSFDLLVYQFFENQLVPPKEMVDDECVWQEPLFSEDKTIENWKRLLAVNVLCDLSQLHQTEVSAKVRLFERQPWNQSSQYFRALVALNHALAKMPIPEVGPRLLESGAALIDLHEYCPWLSLPYTPYHYEYGIYLCLLALLTRREDLQEIVLRLAHWQLNTLDADAAPLSGLFVREKEGRTLQPLFLSYLLFRGASSLSEKTPFASVALAALRIIQDRHDNKREKIDPLWPLIENYFTRLSPKCSMEFLEMGKQEALPLELSEHIYDPSTALAGYRSSSQHVICTLHGGHTGLGVLRHEDIEIVSYGPQYLPLEECQGFGIEGNALTDQGMRRSQIEWRRQSFVLKGCTRLVDQPSSLPFGIGRFRGIWLEVSQEFKRPHFFLKTTFLGLDGWESLAFSFFVKARGCRTQSLQYLRPHMLDRYEGEPQTLTFEGRQTTLVLRSLSFKGTMQVISLRGGNNFWGADFLVAYLLHPDQRHYQWHVGPEG
jgi:hypothetical protein